MKFQTNIKQHLTALLTEMVLHPDQLRVDVITVGINSRITITATHSDSRKIVGAGGVYFSALKMMTSIWAARDKCGCVFDFVKSVGRAEIEGYPPFEIVENWDREKVVELALGTARALASNPDSVKIETVDGKNGVTNLDVFVSGEQNPEVMRQIMSTLIRPIGKIKGRNLIFNVIQ